MKPIFHESRRSNFDEDFARLLILLCSFTTIQIDRTIKTPILNEEKIFVQEQFYIKIHSVHILTLTLLGQVRLYKIASSVLVNYRGISSKCLFQY